VSPALELAQDRLLALVTYREEVVRVKAGEPKSPYSEYLPLVSGFRERDVDKELVQSLIEVMNQYKIIVTYYGTGFDIPFIRSKALHYDLYFPEYGGIYHHDIFYLVKSKLNLSRKSLDNVCDYLGIKGKTPIDKEIWRLAKYGNKEAIKQVVEHNIGDVVILEQLHEKLEPYRKWIKASV